MGVGGQKLQCILLQANLKACQRECINYPEEILGIENKTKEKQLIW